MIRRRTILSSKGCAFNINVRLSKSPCSGRRRTRVTAVTRSSVIATPSITDSISSPSCTATASMRRKKLPELLAPLVRDEADAVFGSRMIDKEAARTGGMPNYKWIGNQILTTFQNWMLQTNLSEFHSGYRLYAPHALAQLPFECNSGAFHFDTEIIIQLVLK